jgi:flagellar biosynthesis/type III secretory pathway chaperone
MTTPAAQALSGALEGHIRLMRDLIEVSQKEYAQIIAFEHRNLSMSTEEKRALLSQLEASEAQIGAVLRDCSTELGLDSVEPTAAVVASATDGEIRKGLDDQVTCLRALSESLRELQAVSHFHAERGLKLVRSYTALLRGHDPSCHEGGETYTPTGRARRAPLPSQTVTRNA